MTTVAQVLKGKSSEIWSVSPDASVYEALELLAAHDVGALPVVQEGRLIGIVSERDYARKVILKGRLSKETCVRDIMTEKIITVRPEATLQDCMNLMTQNRIRHLPVVVEGRLVGIISIGDVLKAVIAEQEFMIQQMETYIRGGR